jgi:hypothetical protein
MHPGGNGLQMDVVSGVWDRDGRGAWYQSCQLLYVLARKVAVLPSNNQRGASQPAPLCPVVTSSEIRDALDHHLLVESGPQATVAAVKPLGPRLGRQPLRGKELMRGVEVCERDRPSIQPSRDVSGQAWGWSVRRGLHNDQRPHALGIRSGGEKRSVGPHRLPDKRDRSERELVNDRRDVINERDSREIVRPLLAAAVPSLIESQDTKLTSQLGCRLSPLPAVASETVQKQDRRTPAAEVPASQTHTPAITLDPVGHRNEATGPTAPSGSPSALIEKQRAARPQVS